MQKLVDIKMDFNDSNEIKIPRKSLLKLPKVRGEQIYYDSQLHEPNFDVTLASNEMSQFLNSGNISRAGVDFNRTRFTLLNDSDQTMPIAEKTTIREKSNALYNQFLEIMQSQSTDTETFDTIQSLIQACTDVLEETCRTDCKSHLDRVSGDMEWLQQERSTWKLFFYLYKDRIMVKNCENDYEMLPFGCFEKDVISHLYTINASLREYQLVVDWLEMCASEQNPLHFGHFADNTFSWENTLKQLRMPSSTAFGSNREIVRSLDPDAPMREKRPLHDLDMEDEQLLSKYIFLGIRHGCLDEVQALCERCGQPWRAAILEGWRLFNDPNYISGNINEKVPIEGNSQRDIWKRCAWMMADDIKFDQYTRAIAGTFCGHLKALLGPLKDSWEDQLWAYLKTQIDIRVEHEIRTCCLRSCIPMPDSYWDNKMSLEQIFDELSAHKNISVRNSANSYMNVIQKYIILDDIAEMMRKVQVWIQEENLSSQMLRFLSHIVLFVRRMGKQCQENIANEVLKAYVENLIEIGDSQLIAYYTAFLPGEMRVHLYAKYLETVKVTAARKSALEEAFSAGLDVEDITVYTVESIRNREYDETSEKLLHTDISDRDNEKISALEWLTFYPQQKGELIWQANAVIRLFLGEGKIECARNTMRMVPADAISQIAASFGTKDDIPCKEECSIKEFLCHRTYLTAIDSYNDWTRLYHIPPKQPDQIKAYSTFQEKIAAEEKEKDYQADLARWERNLSEQYLLTRELLFNVLLFPDKGWLIDPDSPKDTKKVSAQAWECRATQLENLRKLCIPEIVLLLHKVLHLSGDYGDCIKLADEVASEQRQLYNVYSKHKLAEFLAKVAESSLALMNENSDPWGYTANL